MKILFFKEVINKTFCYRLFLISEIHINFSLVPNKKKKKKSTCMFAKIENYDKIIALAIIEKDFFFFPFFLAHQTEHNATK